MEDTSAYYFTDDGSSYYDKSEDEFDIDGISAEAHVLSVDPFGHFIARVWLPVHKLFPGTQCPKCNHHKIVATPVLFKCELAGVPVSLYKDGAAKVMRLIQGKTVTLECHGFDDNKVLQVSVFEKDAGSIGLCVVGGEYIKDLPGV